MATDKTPLVKGVNTTSQDLLISQVTAYVKVYMNKYDGSHDYAHVQRVLGLALTIANSPTTKPCDIHIVHLAALLHDVGDRKYLQPGDDAKTMVQTLLLSFGADPALATKVQTIVNAVSWNHEMANFELVERLVTEYPELGPVQDADRLDAIGAIGIGRLFTYGGANGGRSLDGSIEHMDEKLVKLEAIMKTEKGRELARERTRRLNVFMEWWTDEQASIKKALEEFNVTS